MKRGELDWVGLQMFVGGQSTDRKAGNRYQFYNSRHIDFRKDPSKVTLLPQPSLATASVVVDLVLDMTALPNGKYYAVGDRGNVYLVGTDGEWENVGNIGEASGAGIDYRADTDCVYITGQTKVARIRTANTNPVFQKDWFLGGISTNASAYKTGGLIPVTIQTSISEAVNNYRTFYPNISPLRKIGVDIKAKGTGDWTLTLHDDANNVIATKTILNAALQNNQNNYFEFGSPLDVSVNTSTTTTPNSRPYHFHLTSTVADGSIVTTTDFADCNFQIYADALTTTRNGIHTITRFQNFSLIDNGRYLTLYEPLQDNPTTADFERHRIILPPGYEMCSKAQKNMMAILGAEQRSSDGKFQGGALFFWNGSADSYIDWYPVPEGSPETLFSHKNVAWYVVDGQITRIRGLDEPKDLRGFRGTDSEYSGLTDITHVYPHMMTVRRGILLMGYASQTTNQNLECAVYSYGASSADYPDSFGNSYTPSHGVKYNDGSNNLRMGMVRNYGDTLYISWRVNNTYGVDIVNNSSVPASDGLLELLRFDDQRPQFYKKAEYMIATFPTALPAGVSIKMKYMTETDTDWQYSEATTSGTYAVFNIGKQFLSIDCGIDITCEGATSPEINSLYLFFNPQSGQQPVNHG